MQSIYSYLPSIPTVPRDVETLKGQFSSGLKLTEGWVRSHPYMTAAVGFVIAKAIKKKISNRLPGKVVLEISIDKLQLTEMPREEMLKVLYGNKTSLMSVLNLIESAESDKRIKAIVIRGEGDAEARGLAHLQELRTALKSYNSKSGNPVVYYTNSFGEATSGIINYWIATFCTHIVLPPCGSLNITSLQATAFFCKKMAEKIGAAPIVTQRRDYKTAANMWTQEKMTDAHKEQSTELLQYVSQEIRKDISEYIAKKNKSNLTVDEILEGGPYQCDKIRELGLVNEVMYVDEVYEKLIPSLVNEDYQKLSFRDFKLYSPFAKKFYTAGRGKPCVAYLPLEGMILQGASKKVYDSGGAVIGSDTICAAIREITRNKNVKGLFIRIDSRGGSYVASDLIHNELTNFKKKTGKPVIVSMSNVAASGGYYIGMVGDKVFASENTISGSIGIVYGKVVWKQLLSKIGITTDIIALGKNSSYFSAVEMPNEDCVQKMEGQTDFIYDDFKKHVSNDTGLTPEEVEEVAQGKVYFGQECLNKKLITNIGGINDALNEMASQLGVSSRHDLHLQVYPELFSYKTLLKGKPKNREESDSNPPISVGGVLLSCVPGGEYISQIAASVTHENGSSLYSNAVPKF